MKGKIDEALRLLDGAVGQSPRRSELYLTRGIVLRKRGDYSKAIADFTTALEIDPTLADAYCQRGFAYQQSQDDNWHEKAFADCNRAIELGHNSALSLLVRGNAYIARNEFERAIADFTNALELNPRSYSAYGNRARAYSRIGKFPEAREDLARAMALNPSPEDLPGLQAIKELLEAQPNAP